MQVVVAGATGFIGREVVRRALEAGHQVFPLIRDGQDAGFDAEAMQAQSLVPLPFGADPEVLHAGFGLDPGAWVINVAGPHREVPGQDSLPLHRTLGTAIAELARENGAARLVHLGPLLHGMEEDPFLQAKAELEGILSGSGAPFTVLRSAPIYGVGDALLDEVGAWMMRSPFIPRFLEEVPLQPLWVGDVAELLLSAPAGRFEVGGTRLAWGDLLRLAAEAAGKTLVGPRLSDETVLGLARRLGTKGPFTPLIPFSEAGFRRHRRGYTVADNALERLLGRAPRSLEDYLTTEWAYRA